MLTQRPTDGSRASFYAWPFMSVHMWGENPNGVWKLEVAYDGRSGGKYHHTLRFHVFILIIEKYMFFFFL